MDAFFRLLRGFHSLTSLLIFCFTFAIGMHYFIRDHSASLENSVLYTNQARWLLAVMLLVGYLVGLLSHIPDALVAIVMAFLAGGVLLNALRYELPKREQVAYVFFLIGALFYTSIILNLK